MGFRHIRVVLRWRVDTYWPYHPDALPRADSIGQQGPDEDLGDRADLEQGLGTWYRSAPLIQAAVSHNDLFTWGDHADHHAIGAPLIVHHVL